MGLFSGIKKGLKKVWKGVKKGFKKVGKWAGKVMSSKWFKGLMIAAAVFTGGMALMAGFGNAMATSGTFMTKFVAGAKGFMGGLMNPVATGKGAWAGAQGGGGLSGALQGAAQGSGALQSAAAQSLQQAGAQGTQASSGLPMTPTEAAPTEQQAFLDNLGKGAGGGAPQPTPAGMSPAGGAPSAGAGAGGAGAGGMLEAAKGMGRGALDFVKSPGGGLMLMGAMQGMAEGKMYEDQMKKGGYVNRRWADERQRMLVEEAGEGMRDMVSGYAERRSKYRRPAPEYRGYARDPRRGG